MIPKKHPGFDFMMLRLTILQKDQKKETRPTPPALQPTYFITLKTKPQPWSTNFRLKGVTVESLSEQTNFWMFRRASDDDIVLDNLGVDQERMLKWIIHIVLAIDNVLEKVFKSFEEKFEEKRFLQWEKWDIKSCMGLQSQLC